jgi:signal transduction histidine kinase
MAAESGERLSPAERQIPGLTPEESALVVRIGVFVKMRWVAIIGVLIASLIATQIFHIRFSLAPIYIICAVMGLYNVLFLYQARHLNAEAANGSVPVTLTVPLRRMLTIPKATSPLIEKARAMGNVNIMVDLAAFTVLLHFTGGIENPFIFYFVFHVILAGILLHYRVAYVTATAAIILVLLLVGLEYFRVIPHVPLEGFATNGMYREGAYIVSVLVALSTCLYASAYMVTSVSGELRKRQREVVMLQQQGLQEKTKELEEAGRDVAKLEEGRKHLLRFLAIASHDLKAPLSAVQSYIQLMLGGFTGQLTDKQKQMLERSSTRITEQLGLISDLLDISRIEGGQIVSEMEEMALGQIAEDAAENVRAQAKEKQIKLEVKVPRGLPLLRASGVRLKQAITNLLANAVKFTPDKGEVELRISARNNDIYTEVLDTGVGISDEDMPHIFEDFYRGGDREKTGTGLGLAIVKRVIEAHGGKIWAESPNPEDKEGRGSKFTFTLPGSLIIAGKKAGKREQAKSRKA